VGDVAVGNGRRFCPRGFAKKKTGAHPSVFFFARTYAQKTGKAPESDFPVLYLTYMP